MSDIAEAENGTFLLTLDHRVHISLLHDIRANDLGTGTTEDYGEQCSNLDDGVADDCGFQFGIGIEFLLGGGLWVLGHEHELLHHALNRLDQQSVDIFGEELQEEDED